ncbi:hypothetical protein [uncultured Chloroflexus sp.]|uniref:P-loop ATPase, Sll1717 family n=1 Tax=uncultured Chloroflexus sp. TaxID=214040 RepID=UPI00261142A5|nr:hypothetical protein [uncultured Chloroflexus sp.]
MSTDTERQRLLTELREMGRASSAELERGEQFQRAFYPVDEHLRVFEPDVNLIVGYHGAGKSMLFKAAVEQLLSASIHKRPFLPEKAVWKAGYPLGSDFPDAETLRRFVKRSLVERSLTEQANDRMLADVWLAYLARLLSSELKTTGEWQALLAPSSVEVDRVYTALRQQRTAVIAALDDLDARLKQEGRWIFVNYDELDTLGGIDWELMAGLIRGLLTFWAEYTRRWQRLQAKIFLRTDLFTNARIFTADFTKLASNRVELTWSDRNLHAMWIKRIANRSRNWLEYCRDAGIQFKRDETLGWIPYLPNAEAAQPLIERIAGPFMGSNIKKGRTFTWILDHLRDGKGRITPRTLVSLWGYAAAQELDSQKASASHLIHPTSLRRALDQVSDDYVKMLKSREMPWLEGLMKRLSNREVPLTREEWIAILATDWTQWRNDTQEKQRPPHQTPAEFLDLLLELGVCRERPDGRIDVPDLFLHGLAIKRRGGVKR